MHMNKMHPDWIIKLRHLYGQHVPPRDYDFDQLLPSPATSCQNDLYQGLFVDEPFQTLPPAVYYRSKFLKKLIEYLEKKGEEVIEEVLNEYVSNLGSADATTIPKGSTFKTYFLDSAGNQTGKYATGHIVLEEEIMTISQGTTGLRTWTAGLRFIEYLQSTSGKDIKDKTIVELGCGVGLVGLCMDRMGASKVFMTDCETAVVDRVKANAKRNQSKNVQVGTLWWGEPLETVDFDFSQTDLVVGSDLFYHDELLQPLLTTLLEIFHLSAKKDVHALFALTRRKEETYSHLMKLIGKNGLQAEPISLDNLPQPHFHYDEDWRQVQLLRVSMLKVSSCTEGGIK